MRSATAFAALALLAAVASAFQVTSPNNVTGWSSSGSNTLTWTRVSTDPTSFDVVLTNTDRSVMPVNDQTLASNVDASSATSLVIPVPAGGFNPGGSYRIDLISTDTTNSGILAQSSEFNITSGTGSATGSTTASSASGSGSSTTSGTITTTGTGTTLTATNVPTGSGTTTDLNPSQSSGAMPRAVEFSVLGAFLGLVGFLA